jgi:hypothetical protein
MWSLKEMPDLPEAPYSRKMEWKSKAGVLMMSEQVTHGLEGRIDAVRQIRIEQKLERAWQSSQ